MRSTLLVLTLALITVDSIFGASTVNPTKKFAYAANAGWINFQHDQPLSADGIVVGEYTLSGYAYAANLGWIDFGDGSPDDGIRYENDSATDFGVNLDSSGNLSGFAYAANIGWLNFGWATSGDSNRPRVNLFTGAFAGYAYSANCGWIHLGTGFLVTDTLFCLDLDNDGIGDQWEREHFFGSLAIATALTDSDGDGSSDVAEYAANTDPNDPDSRFRIISQLLDPGLDQVNLNFTTAPGRLYQFEYSNDLVEWAEDNSFLPNSLPVMDEDFFFKANDSKFYRLRALKPLQ